jgi:acetyl esterase/lipase
MRPSHRFSRSLFAAFVGLGTVLSLPVAVRADEPAPAVARAYEVETIRNLAYYEGEGADKVRHKLDLFVPKEVKNFPVVLFVHGGAWRNGDKDFLGIYTKFGQSLARQGIGAVVCNYRLSPAVKHPEHVRDVARAFAWMAKNTRKYGGAPDQLFVCGHSAGGHLVALLATNEKYLKAEGLQTSSIRGVIAMSGPYRIPEQSPLFNVQFGEEVEARKDASPLEHVHEGAPPFLILYAENELPYCGKATAETFCKALCDKKCAAYTREIKARNHMTLIVLASKDGDPVAGALQEFVGKICKKPAE